jgi:hypothetical protein
VYAIEACVVENLDRNYRNRDICILSAKLRLKKALTNYRIISTLVWDYDQSLITEYK